MQNKPDGFTTATIPLSTELRKEHLLQTVDVFTDRTKSGFVQNNWRNQHLSGSFVVHRSKPIGPFDALGQPKKIIKYKEFVPLPNILVELDQVEKQQQEELERIGGSVDEEGRAVPGEVEELREVRAQILSWLDQTPEEKEDIHNFFGCLADGRKRAINPSNIVIGQKAEKMHSQKSRLDKDNPPALAAMTHPTEGALTDRYEELIKRISVTDDRRAQVYRWLFQENTLVGGLIDNFGSALRGKADIYDLQVTAQKLRFDIQPANQLKAATEATGRQIEDDDQIVTAIEGYNFARLKNYLLVPFRQLSPDYPLEELPEFDMDPKQSIAERMAALEELALRGPYNHLRGRLLTAAQLAISGIDDCDINATGAACQEFKKLTVYHCLPGEAEAEVWYKHHF